MKSISANSLKLCSLLLVVNSMNAAATRIAYIDAFATSRGNAFTATADNASAVFYNAAGLTQTEGTQVRSNAYIVSLSYEYSGAFGTAETDDFFQVIPSFFASHKFEDQPYAIGFGMYAPFGLGVDWGENAPFAQVAYDASLAYIKYHVVFSWQVNETLSIGFGPSYDTGDIELKNTDVLQSFEGDDDTVGYSLSVLWQPSEKHSFGLNYQGATEMEFDGTATGFIPSTGRLVFPDSIVLGYSYRPNEKWNIEFDIDWTNWDKVDDLRLDIAGTIVPLPLNWKNSFNWELGATRFFENGWHASAGYTYVENAVPDDAFTPIVSDSDRHYLQFGVGRDYEHISWHFSYQFTIAPTRTVSGNVNVLPDGEYDLESQAITLSFGYRF
ncbi:MAG: OmpP1/FadL family transporter [Opitutaceae bacterium]